MVLKAARVSDFCVGSTGFAVGHGFMRPETRIFDVPEPVRFLEHFKGARMGRRPVSVLKRTAPVVTFFVIIALSSETVHYSSEKMMAKWQEGREPYG
jgi:hypothetical protein